MNAPIPPGHDTPLCVWIAFRIRNLQENRFDLIFHSLTTGRLQQTQPIPALYQPDFHHSRILSSGQMSRESHPGQDIGSPGLLQVVIPCQSVPVCHNQGSSHTDAESIDVENTDVAERSTSLATHHDNNRDSAVPSLTIPANQNSWRTKEPLDNLLFRSVPITESKCIRIISECIRR